MWLYILKVQACRGEAHCYHVHSHPMEPKCIQQSCCSSVSDGAEPGQQLVPCQMQYNCRWSTKAINLTRHAQTGGWNEVSVADLIAVGVCVNAQAMCMSLCHQAAGHVGGWRVCQAPGTEAVWAPASLGPAALGGLIQLCNHHLRTPSPCPGCISALQPAPVTVPGRWW